MDILIHTFIFFYVILHSFCVLISHSENIVSLDIYFQSLTYDEFEQVAKSELWVLFGKYHKSLHRNIFKGHSHAFLNYKNLLSHQ